MWSSLICRPLHTDVTASASFWSRENDPCQDGGAISFGDVTRPADAMTLPSSFGHGDPTMFDEIDLTIQKSDRTFGDCFNTIVARAPLNWTMPYLRPWLVSVVDAGPRDAATGEVVVRDRLPVTYTVAPNDLIEEVAGRFGMSVDDLFYLNESRMPVATDHMLYVGEELNLDIRLR